MYLLEDYAIKDQPLSKILSDVDAALVVSIQISRNFGFIIKILIRVILLKNFTSHSRQYDIVLDDT